MDLILRFKILFSVLLLLFFTEPASANRCEILFLDHHLQSDHVGKIPTRENGPGFIVPNEKGIGSISSTLKKAAPGIYVSVGTERGFMAASVAGESVKALAFVDIDTRPMLFDLTNVALLQLAREGDRQDYLHLRLKASHQEILMRTIESQTISHESRTLLERPEVWDWWVSHVQFNREFHDFHDPLQRNYQGANYLFIDKLFRSVEKLAKQGRIFVYHDNLTSPVFQARLTRLTNSLQTRVSVFDVSNAWDYIGAPATISVIHAVAPLLTPESFLIFTYMTANPNPHENSAVFRYWISRNDHLASYEELGPVLGNLKRMDPSQASTATNRSRRSRFGDDF